MAASRPVREKRRTYLFGVIGLVLVGFVLYLAATAHRGLPWDRTTTVRAAFDNTASLKAGDQVRQFSSRIGKVSDIEFADERALVTMQLDGDREVYADAKATILDFSALSQKFVELDPGTPAAGPLGDGVITVERTTDSVDLYQVLNVFDEPTRTGLSTTLREFGGGASGHGQDLDALVKAGPDLLPDLGNVSAAFAAGEADLPEFLRSTDRLASRFADRRGDIEATVRQFGETLDGFAVDGAEPLSATLQKLPTTLDTANTAFTALDRPLGDTAAAFAATRPGFESLGEATPDLRGVFRESPEPFGKLPEVSDHAVPALEDLTDTASDLQPLAPRLADTFERAQEPLDVLKPFAPELGYLIVRLHSFVSEGVAPGIHYARVNANLGAPTLTSAGVEDEFFFPHNPYPKPGEADRDRAGGVGGTR